MTYISDTKKNYKNNKLILFAGISLVSSLATILLFQNCSPQWHSDTLSEYSSDTGISIATDGTMRYTQPRTATPEIDTIPSSPTPSLRSATPPPNSSPTPINPPKTTNAAANSSCATDVASLGWSGSGNFLKLVTSTLGYDQRLVGQQRLPRTKGLSLSFFGTPADVDEHSYLAHVPAGYEIKLTDVNSNNSFIVKNSQYTNFSEIGTHITKYNRLKNRSTLNAIGSTILVFNISREVYDLNPGFNRVKVDLLCQGYLVASGLVDFSNQYIHNDLNASFEKDENANNLLIDMSGQRISYFYKPATGWIKAGCPLKSNVGQKVVCNSSMENISSFQWHIQGQHAPSLDNVRNPSFTPSAGNYNVELIGINNQGQKIHHYSWVTVQ